MSGLDRQGREGDSPIVVFDTDCVLCSGTVAFILRHERAPEFCFVGAWSPTGLALAARHGFSKADLDESFLVIVGGVAHRGSDAGLQILQRLRPPWRWFVLFRVVPRKLRDLVYAAVARRRYRWFGHSPACFTPPPDQRHRFADLTGHSLRSA